MVEALDLMASHLHILGEAGVLCWETKVEEDPLSSSRRGAPTIIIMHLHYTIILLRFMAGQWTKKINQTRH